MTFLELEKKCKKRRLLRIIRVFFLFLILLALVYFSYIFFSKNKELKKYVIKEKVEEKSVLTNKKINYINEKVIENNISKNKVVNSKQTPTLKLFLDFNISEENKTKKDIKNRQNIKKEIKNGQSLKKDLKKSKNINKEQSYKKNIKTTESNFTKSFIKTILLPSFDTCILLANKYYKEGNYKEALKWAKNANIQDNKKAISWILSAKILNKMGKKKEAIELLKLYYNYNKDNQIKKLMEQLSE